MRWDGSGARNPFTVSLTVIVSLTDAWCRAARLRVIREDTVGYRTSDGSTKPLLGRCFDGILICRIDALVVMVATALLAAAAAAAAVLVVIIDVGVIAHQSSRHVVLSLGALHHCDWNGTRECCGYTVRAGVVVLVVVPLVVVVVVVHLQLSTRLMTRSDGRHQMNQNTPKPECCQVFICVSFPTEIRTINLSSDSHSLPALF